MQIPSVPNFILLEMPPVRRQDGWQEAPKVSIADMSELQLREIGRLWTNALIARAKQIRDLK